MKSIFSLNMRGSTSITAINENGIKSITIKDLRSYFVRAADIFSFVVVVDVDDVVVRLYWEFV